MNREYMRFSSSFHCSQKVRRILVRLWYQLGSSIDANDSSELLLRNIVV